MFHDPAADVSIATLERAIAEARLEREGRVQAEARADTAEARNRELEGELRRLRGG